MNENIKEIIAERIKYHSNKQKYGYFMGNECIDICASDILDDVIKAGYRKQEDTVTEFANIVISECEHLQEHCEEMNNNDAYDYVEILIAEINRQTEQYSKENETK